MKVEINIAEEKVGVGTCNGHMIISALFASSMLKDWPFWRGTIWTYILTISGLGRYV